MENITQIMPAPGWRVFRISEGDGQQPDIEELPIIGWAVSKDGDPLYDTNVDLLCWDDTPVLLNQLDTMLDSLYRVLPPDHCESIDVFERWKKEWQQYLEDRVEVSGNRD